MSRFVQAFKHDFQMRLSNRQNKPVSVICSCEKDPNCQQHIINLNGKRFSRITLEVIRNREQYQWDTFGFDNKGQNALRTQIEQIVRHFDYSQLSKSYLVAKSVKEYEAIKRKKNVIE